MSVRVVVVEDQALYRQMLVGLLQAAPGIQLVNSAGSFAEGALIDTATFDVALVDVELGDGDGIDLGRHYIASNSEVNIVLLSAVDATHRLRALGADERGHWSYLSKTSALSAGSLLNTLTTAASGHAVIDRVVTERRSSIRDSPLDALTERQISVLALLTSGFTNAAIADELGIAVRSVDNHVNAIYDNLGIASTQRTNPRVTAAALFLEHTR